jgi:hypothetical protein
MIFLPFLMSLGVLALAMLGPERLPLHDEGLVEHLGMLLLAGQVPLILWGLFRRRWRAALLQTAGLGLAFYLVTLSETAELDKVQARIEAAKPFPGGEAAARSLAAEQGLGTVQSIAFAGIDTIGWDIYAVTFEKGERHIHLYLSEDGKLLGSTFADGPAGCRSTEIYDCRYLDQPYSPLAARRHALVDPARSTSLR